MKRAAVKLIKGKGENVTTVLGRRSQELDVPNRAERTLSWLETQVWPQLPPEVRGHAPTKREQEELLGF